MVGAISQGPVKRSGSLLLLQEDKRCCGGATVKPCCLAYAVTESCHWVSAVVRSLLLVIALPTVSLKSLKT